MGRQDGKGSGRSGRQQQTEELSQPALRAMAEAARRSREGGGRPPARPARSPTDVVGDRIHLGPAPDHGGRVRQERRLRTSVIAAASLLAALVVALAVSTITGQGASPPPGAQTAAPPRPRPPGSTVPGAAASGPVVTTTSTPPTTTTPPTTPPTTAAPTTAAPTTLPASPTPTLAGGPSTNSLPVLSSLSPSSGVAGSDLAVSGSNFISGDGQILIRFGGQVAPTRCPTPTSCTVTVPPMPRPRASVPVTITTQAGTSKPLRFSYG